MAGYRIPGPIGIGANHPVIDEGTSARSQMFPPGPAGIGADVPVALDAPVAQPVDAPAAQFTMTPIAQATAARSSRALTPGEIEMCKRIFKDSVDYSTVKVHNHGYFGQLQSKRTAVTPNGEIYFNSEDFKEDFSAESDPDQHWFMHEMVHVWQKQLGYPVKLVGLFSFAANYSYVLSAEKRLHSYRMEQQAEILADYYLLKVLNNKVDVSNPDYANNLPLYEESILVDFLADPASKLNLPRQQKARRPHK
jgi:type VI secretion system secreted protein VgrG